MLKFTHLHVHSHYSLLDGLPKIDELLNYAKKLGMDSLAITDHGVLYGGIEFYKKAIEKGIKPIIGSEVYVALEGMDQKRPNIDDKKYHLILLAKNEEGYKNLVKLITKAHLDGFYYKPRVDEELLEKYSGGLICLSACVQGKIPRLILAKKIEEAEKLATKYQKIFGKGNFYLEIQHHPNIKEQETVNKGLISLSKKLNIPLVATNDVHYLKPDDAEGQDILMLINTGSKLDDPERLTLKSDDFSLRSPQEMEKDFHNIPEALKNTQKIADACNLKIELGKIKLPYYPLPEGKTADDYLKELCYQGIKKRYEKKNREITDRLEYELSVIKQTGFASYFLIVQDFVNWAKGNRIVVGPGRGSAAGSLASYLLNITNVDPIKHNLLFERFINPERISPPDIDLDFTDWRRDEVIEYVSQKYGKNRVAQIITFGTMAAKAAIRDVGRALGYTYSYCDHVAKMIPMFFTLDQTLKNVDEFRNLYQTDAQAKRLIDLAKKLEGVARHASTHACGVVISKDPLSNIVPLQHPTQNDETIITQYEMHAIEDLGILKMDFLGLKNLTIIEDTLTRVYVVQNKKIDIENIPLDDKKTFRILQKGETVSVFQLESEGMRRYLKQLKPTEFEDITAMVALYRPGPMQFIPQYISGKHKKRKIEYVHPDLKPILESTYGIIVYQEQLIKIAQKLAGFTVGEADTLRKAVGKKIKELLVAQQEKMIDGMVKNGIEKNVANRIWEWVLPFASYGFNRSHAASYATIAYQTAYLKAHFPIEFMAAVLTSEKADTERIAVLIEECKKMSIEVLPPDINESFRNFTVVPKENKIRFGLLAIKNVGSNIVEVIVKERKEKGPFKSIDDFVTRVKSRDLNKKSLESLIKSGALDRLGERGQLLHNLERLLEWSKENQKAKTNGQKSLFDSASFTAKIQLETIKPAANHEMLTWEKELLGLYVTSHPLNGFEKILAKASPIAKINDILNTPVQATNPGHQTGILSHLPTLPNPFTGIIKKKERVRIGGIILNVKKIITKTGKPMLFLKVEDLTDKIEVVVFPSMIERNPTVFQENKIVFINGRLDERDGILKIICEEAEEIIES